MGTVEIRVRSETIETIARDTDLDAIVSSDDSMLSMGGGVSAAIGSIAGSAIRDEVVAELPLPVGAIAVTSGGQLPVRYIIHAITIDTHERIVPTARTVRQLYREILSRCEALQVERIAVPALATGAAGVDSRISAENLAYAIHAHTANPTVLKSIVLPIPDANMFLAFTRALAAPSSEDITGSPVAPTQAGERGDPPAQREDSERRAGSLRGLEGADAGIFADRHITSEPITLGIRAWLSRLRTSRHEIDSTQPAPSSGPVTARVDAGTTIDSRLSRPLLGNRYVLLEEVGRGGMAVVHLAWDLVLRRTVAIKILRPDCADPQSLKREATTAFELTHDSIVRLYHFEPAHAGTDAYLVMEYLAWPSGEKWIADAGAGGLPAHAVQEVGIRVCDALAYAHSRKVLHLDIKPSNVFVDPAGESAKLGDFGLARFSNSGGAALQVKPQGTPAYMAPEQLTVGAKVTAATDVYQTAATLWDFLTGSPPKPLTAQIPPLAADRHLLISILRQALTPEPSLRPTASRLGQLIGQIATA